MGSSAWYGMQSYGISMSKAIDSSTCRKVVPTTIASNRACTETPSVDGGAVGLQHHSAQIKLCNILWMTHISSVAEVRSETTLERSLFNGSLRTVALITALTSAGSSRVRSSCRFTKSSRRSRKMSLSSSFRACRWSRPNLLTAQVAISDPHIMDVKTMPYENASVSCSWPTDAVSRHSGATYASVPPGSFVLTPASSTECPKSASFARYGSSKMRILLSLTSP